MAESASDQQLLEDFKTLISQLRQTNELTDEEKETLKTTYQGILGAPDISEWFAVPEGDELEGDPDFLKDYNKKRDELMSTITENRAKITELSETRKLMLESKSLKTRSNDDTEKKKKTLKILDERVVQFEEQNKKTLVELEKHIASLYTDVYCPLVAQTMESFSDLVLEQEKFGNASTSTLSTSTD